MPLSYFVPSITQPMKEGQVSPYPAAAPGIPLMQVRDMPLKSGKSKKVVSENISEFHTGKTYAKTKAKFGKAKADKQAVAVAMSKKRKS
jgi:hypothetical protein